MTKGPTQKKEIELSISNSVPPYNMIEEGVPDYPGIQIEIVNLAFDRLGLKVKWRTMTNNRAIKEITTGRTDGALNLSSFVDNSKDGVFFHSIDIITFQNCLIGKISDQTKFATLEDFQRHLSANKKIKVIGFQGAAKIFKDSLPNLASLPNYEEVPHQKIMAASLLATRTEYILSDYLVYQYYAKQIKKPLVQSTSFTCLHKIPSAARAITFRDQALQIKFDKEMQQIINSGEKERIIKKYELFLARYLNKNADSLMGTATYVANVL